MISLAPLHDVMARTGLDAVALVPGANFLRIFGKDFHQMERPLVVVVPRTGAPVAIVPNLEMGSFTPLGFPGEVFDWRDEEGYMEAFRKAGTALTQLGKGSRVGVEGQRMRVFDFQALQSVLPQAQRLAIIRACKGRSSNT
jgi:Xaa-Pro dipeptidase